MARVFISHAGRDEGLAALVQQWLQADRHEVFLDRDRNDGIRLGEEWKLRLHEELRAADAVVCVVTSAYVSSHWCTTEVAVAWSNGKRVLPLVAEPGVEHLLLDDIQHIDMHRDHTETRRALSDALLRIDGSGGAGWPDGRSPFPGLVAFDKSLRRVFFGRSRDVGRLVEAVRSPAGHAKGVHLVVGPSGCGKSSLVKAALVPEIAGLPEWWTVPVFVPGKDPVRALAEALTDAGREVGLAWTDEQVLASLDSDGLALVADTLIEAAPDRRAKHLLIVVDQGEELLTLAGEAERARFARILVSGSRVRVVVTLRSEFQDQFVELLDLTDPVIHAVRPLGREGLREVIEGPAHHAGIRVEGGLVARLVADTGSGEALPLLAFILHELAIDGRLSADRYDQLGGVQRALSNQADKALTEAVTAALAEAEKADRGLTGERAREDVLTGLLRLVTVDEQGNPTSWRVDRSELPDTVGEALKPFIDRGLLITDKVDDGSAMISVAHEAFLTAWEPLKDAIESRAAALRARRTIEHGATEWDRSGRPRERLWERGQLAAAVADIGARVEYPTRAPDPVDDASASQGRRVLRLPWHQVVVTDHHIPVSATAERFLLESVRRDRYRSSRAAAILSTLLVLALFAAGVAVVQQRATEDRQRVATARLLLTRAEAVIDSDPRTAIQLGIAAHHIRPDRETQAGLTHLLLNTNYAGPLEGHTDTVNAVAFTSDRHILAAGDNDGAVLLWDLTDPSRPHRIGDPLTGPAASVSSVAFSPDGSTLATGTADDDGTVLLWDVTEPERAHRIGNPLADHIGSVEAVAFTPDGHTLATAGDDGTVFLWDVTEPERAHRIGNPLTGHIGSVEAVAFTLDGHTLATAGGATPTGVDGVVLLWDVTDPSQPHRISDPLTGHNGSVNAVAFTPDGHTLATAGAGGGTDGTVLLWDVTEPAQPHRIGDPLTGHASWATSVAFSPDGHTLASADGVRTVLLWNVTDPSRPHRIGDPLTSPTGSVSSVAFSPDGHTLATANGDRTVLWDMTDPAQARRIGDPPTDATGPAKAVAFAPDRNILAAATTGVATATELAGVVLLWDATDPYQPRRIGDPLIDHDGWVKSVAFSPDGNILATAGWNDAVLLWDLTDLFRPRRIDAALTGHSQLVNSVAFSPNRHTLATASDDGTVLLWDVTDPERAHRIGGPLTGHTGSVRSVAFSPDGNTLATAGWDHTALLWDVTDPSRPGRIGVPLTNHTSPVNAVAFAPDRKTLATATGDQTVLWDLTDPEQARPIGNPLTGHTRSVEAVAFTPDGTTLATASWDHIVLWDLTDPGQARPIGNPLTSYDNSVAFAPDGTTLATAGGGRTALWDLTSLNARRDHPVRRACAITRGGLSPDQWARHVSDLPYEDSCAT